MHPHCPFKAQLKKKQKTLFSIVFKKTASPHNIPFCKSNVKVTVLYEMRIHLLDVLVCL